VVIAGCTLEELPVALAEAVTVDKGGESNEDTSAAVGNPEIPKMSRWYLKAKGSKMRHK
jgi:hypothetical protein